MRTLCLAFLILFLGCKDTIKNDSIAREVAENISFDTPDITKNTKIVSKADLLGFWVGEFNCDVSEKEVDKIIAKDSTQTLNLNKKITFSIDKISGSSVEGHSVVGGNIASFEGELKKNADSYELEVIEIGAKRTNGKFVLEIEVGNTELNGQWRSNSKVSVPIYSRKLKLKKRFFTYNPENKLEDQFIDYENHRVIEQEYEEEDSLGNPIKEKYEEEGYFTTTTEINKWNPSTQVLQKDVVENLSKADIYILRNLIFARHGYTFRDRKLREYFDNHSWYMPVFGDVKKSLTAIEKKNIDLLLRYEQNAKEYYDYFGR